MRTIFLTSLISIALLTQLSNDLIAHGGSYTGPGDIVPPGPGGGGPSGHPTGPTGPTTGVPGQPTAPSPMGPATGGGNGPATGGGNGPTGGGPGGRTGVGFELTTDLTTWDYWWEFNKEPYLRLKDAVQDGGPVTGDDEPYLGERLHAKNLLRPTQHEIEDLLPMLKQAIDSTSQRDITSSCMVAMAKIGQNHPTFRLIDVFAPRLQRNDQEIRETAALALGIAAVDGSGELDLLVDLALDSRAGRAACAGAVDDRTRSFALYGLGLFAHEHTSLAIKQKAFTALRSVLNDTHSVIRDLKVAAIHGIGLLNIGRSDAEATALQDEALDCLANYYDMQLGSGEQLIQSHCPTAIVKLIGRQHPRSAEFKARFAKDLAGKGDVKRSSNDIPRSCALALGRLCEPDVDAKSADAKYSDILFDAYENHRDVQTRNFALLALGQIGGEANRIRLLRTLPQCKQATERPWCALALGLLAFAERQEHGVDQVIGDVLLQQFKDAKGPNLVSALAVAIGLDGNVDATAPMRQRLNADLQKEDQAGYLCIGMALLRDRAAIDDIRQAFLAANRRPQLLKQSAVALGVLGDKSAAETLHKKMIEEDANLATLAAVSAALGRIGDRRSIQPLETMLLDPSRHDLPRAFAAVALGGIADRALLPWTTKISLDINYRAVVETLINQQSGILDIL